MGQIENFWSLGHHPEAGKSQGGERPGRMARVLVVDDDPGLVEAIETFLSLSGFNPVVARTTQEAEVLLAIRPDALVCDIVLPGPSGLRFAEAVRQLDPDLPIILMTGFGSDLIAAEAQRLGVAGFLRKPFVLSDLVEVLRRVLGPLAAGSGQGDPPSGDDTAPEDRRDRRGSPRIPMALPVRCFLLGRPAPEPAEGRTLDLSEGGVGLELPTRLWPPVYISLSLFPEAAEVRAEARIMWWAPGRLDATPRTFRYGARFSRLSPDDLERLRSLLARPSGEDRPGGDA